MHVPQQKKQPEDFFSKLDEAVSNLENLQDDMLVDVPEVTSGSEGIANQSNYTPSGNDNTTSLDPSNATNSKRNTPDSGQSPTLDAPNLDSSSPAAEISPYQDTPPSKSVATATRDLQNPRPNPPTGQALPGHDFDGEGPSHLLPDELRDQLPGVGPSSSTSANQASDSLSNTSSASLPTPRTTIVPDRIGILAQDPWLNALFAIAIAAVISIYPAWEAGRRLHDKTVTPHLTELEDAISRPLAVQDNTLRKPATIASDIRTSYNKIQNRYYVVWFIVLCLVGLPLALIRKKNPLAVGLKLN